MPRMQDLLGQLWKEYAQADSRYLTIEPFVLCMESITAVCVHSCYLVNNISSLTCFAVWMGATLLFDSLDDRRQVSIPPSNTDDCLHGSDLWRCSVLWYEYDGGILPRSILFSP